MPGMDGFVTVAAISARWGERRPFIFALTADAMAGDRERCLEAGMDDFVTKPISIATVREVMSRWHTRLLVRRASQVS